MYRVSRRLKGHVTRWPMKQDVHFNQDPRKQIPLNKKKAFLEPHQKDEFALPNKAEDVLREYIHEDHFRRKYHLMMPADSPIYDEERFAKFQLAIGTVHRRIASDRVEVAIKDSKFLDVVNKFFNDTGLIVMKDNGETRIGEFVMAKLEDVNNPIYTHVYHKTIRVKGHGRCPFTGLLIKQNRLSGERVLSLEETRKMYDEYADGKVVMSKYRDDPNVDRKYYELKWSSKQLEESIEKGKEVAAKQGRLSKRRFSYQRLEAIKNMQPK